MPYHPSARGETNGQQLFSALITVVIGVGGAAGYFYLANKILDIIWPPRGPALEAARNQRIAATIRPWLFLGPAMFFLGLYLSIRPSTRCG